MTRAKTHRILLISALATLMLLGGFVPALTVRGYTHYTIPQIQGTGWTTPFAWQYIETYGIVTADYQWEDKRGFFLQDPIGDGNPDTSDGIFVYERYDFDVNVGDEIIIAGRAREYYDLTQLDRVQYVDIVSTGNPLPDPISLDPPSDNDASDAYYEKLEGMLVSIPDMRITDANNQYGETAGCRIYHDIDRVFENDPEMGMLIFTDDGGGYDLDVRTGWLVYDVVGPLDYTFDDYKVLPASDSDPRIVPKESGMGIGRGRANTKGISIATYNMYNFFSYYSNFETQKAKHAYAIRHYFREPDLLALQEVHNRFVLEELVATAPIKVTYGIVHIDCPDDRGIDVALLYNTEKFNVISYELRQTHTYLNDGYGPEEDLSYPLPTGANHLFSRPPLVVHLEVLGKKGDNQDLWVIANHFKSKSVYEPYYADTLPRRIEQAEWVSGLVDEIQVSDPNAKVFVVGDLNDFEYSVPIGILEAGGLHDLMLDIEKASRYTYNYRGYSQVLDHILVTPSLECAITEVMVVHFNLDYPFSSYEHDPSLGLCASDHDAVLVGFVITNGGPSISYLR